MSNYKLKDDPNAYTSKNISPESSSGKAKKPEEYNKNYSSLANDVLKDYLSRDEYKYNVNTDKLYKQYADKYKREGQAAMRDTMANASILSGGYGNSYAATAGNQAYQSYLEKLNDIIPELEKSAYQRYLDTDSNLKERLERLSELDKSEYTKYRDSVEDYQKDREFYEDNYRYREDADMEMYKALYEYLLEEADLENDRTALMLQNQKNANDYKLGLLKQF
ncbi:MAG: hypothetical protein IKU52_05170 [Clostridia bacterium]|nr:hypothetical protein [Clostridia bacterium]